MTGKLDYSKLDYSAACAALISKTRAREAALGLRDQTCCSRFLLHPTPTAKVILFFHGFTAVPQQFVPIGEALFREGYNVLIPLLPGHGQAGEWDRENPPPLPQNQQIYQEFGLNWLEQAHAFGEAIVIGGLSGGSTLSAWLALECPQSVDRALLFAPYLSSTSKMLDWCVERLSVYFEWQPEPETESFGYEGFYVPALRVFLEMGREVLKRAETLPAAPMLLVSSEGDQAVGGAEHRALFEAALQRQPKCWYHCFDRTLEIQHNMMTKAEGNAHVDLVINIAKAYIESDLTWAEVQALRQLLAQGEALPAAIVQLNLEHRTAPEIAVMLKL